MEIFEGDIVRVEDDVFEVYYGDTEGYPAFEIKGWLGDDNGLMHIVEEGECEIIGNVWKNPELLKAN